ncbi:MAG: serine/threonine protein kinase, bacterial [Mycobacterium sp.]|nr:serine/threonine protein kinase, bacterial [Mycobacterium sp.]
MTTGRVGTGRVLKLAPGASAPTALPLTGLQRSWGVTVDSKGNLYVADSINDRVLKLPVQ